jgi:hypothetical protein
MKPRTLRAIKKWLIATLLAVSPSAFAERDFPGTPGAPDHPGVHAESLQAPPGAVIVDPHAVPTKHFNWAGNGFSVGKKDVYGGPLGDGKMTDHDGNVLMHVVEEKVPDPNDRTKTITVPKLEVLEEEVMSPPFVFMLLNFGILLLIPRPVQGLGIAVVSTSRGVLSDRKCREQRVGGEWLATIE